MTRTDSYIRLKSLFATIIASICFFIPAHGMEERLQASLITCYPGPEIYELEGHEAIRIRGIDLKGEPIDSVWNYGVFDFNAPNFVWRFVKGETDYMVAAEPFPLFMTQYVRRGSKVVEQDLNLTAEETYTLRHLLQFNSLPQNCTYRYNYVRDNCSTRVLNIVEAAVAPRKIILPDSVSFTSFRNAMRYYHRNYPWYQFGIDLALGGGIDLPITSREETFAPVMLEEKMAKAHFNNGEPIVKSTQILNQGTDASVLPATEWWQTPLFCSLIILAISIISAIYEWRRLKIVKWWMCAFFSLLGLAGCVVCFLVFISTHDSTSPNMLIFWLNPLQFILALSVWWRSTRHIALGMTLVNIIVLMVMVIAWPLQVQSANPAFFPLWGATIILCLAYAMVMPKGKRELNRRGKRELNRRGK